MNKQVWNGEGLPPVGTVCEIKRVEDWLMVTIKYISDCHTVFVTNGGTEGCYQTCALQFRPIRTPEQIEAERRERVVNQIHNLWEEEIDRPLAYVCYAIYDAIRAGKIEGVKIDERP